MEKNENKELIDIHEVYKSGEKYITLRNDVEYYSLTGKLDIPNGVTLNTNESSIWLNATQNEINRKMFFKN